VAVSAGLVVVGIAFAPLVSGVFAAAGSEAANSAGYRLQLLALLPDLQPFGWASTAYQVAGQTVLANVPTTDGLLQTIDNALLLVGLSYGWVPLVVLLLGLLMAVRCPDGLPRRADPGVRHGRADHPVLHLHLVRRGPGGVQSVGRHPGVGHPDLAGRHPHTLGSRAPAGLTRIGGRQYRNAFRSPTVNNESCDPADTAAMGGEA
jgi:hypothetical protein